MIKCGVDVQILRHVTCEKYKEHALENRRLVSQFFCYRFLEYKQSGIMNGVVTCLNLCIFYYFIQVFKSNSNVFACCCYLPPNHSTRQVDAHEFFDTLLSSIYNYQDEGLIFFICGDFNSRCSDNADYIVGVDEIPERDVVDFSCNWYGEIFIVFLINANYCMLNGRNFVKNDFTSVSGRGSAVVDYCIVSHDSLPAFENLM